MIRFIHGIQFKGGVGHNLKVSSRQWCLAGCPFLLHPFCKLNVSPVFCAVARTNFPLVVNSVPINCIFLESALINDGRLSIVGIVGVSGSLHGKEHIVLGRNNAVS